MTMEILTALLAFAFVSSITPGPNNLMLVASGANFGFRRTIPHMLGIAIGFAVMLMLIGVGLIGLFEAFPVSYEILKYASIGYLLYLAWKIANAAPPAESTGGTDAAGRPFTFLQAAAFQWVNPKAWAMGLTATSVYAASQSIEAVGLVAIAFITVTVFSVSCWTLLGQQIRRLLTSRARLRIFNVMMALLLVASLYPVLFP